MAQQAKEQMGQTPFGPTQTLPTRPSLVQKFAAQYSIEPEKLLGILKATAFKQEKGEVSNEQMAALLAVADRYHLDPFTREIYAFADKYKGIVPIVSLDGWSRIINDHPQSDGFEFRVSSEEVVPPGGKVCPTWMEVLIHRKDRGHAIVVREYLDEVYREKGKRQDGSEFFGPWQTHTKRMLRHKTLIQGARIAYGFSGIYDEDEAERIIEGEVIQAPREITKTGAAGLKDAVVAKRAEPTPESVTRDVVKCCEKALACEAMDVALLALDDAKDLARVLDGKERVEADACIKDAQDALDSKFGAKPKK